MVRHVIADKGGNKIARMVIPLLEPKLERLAGGATGGGEQFGLHPVASAAWA